MKRREFITLLGGVAARSVCAAADKSRAHRTSRPRACNPSFNFTEPTVEFFANLPVSNETRVIEMAHKWTKASRAKLSRSQKARWRKRKRQRTRKRRST